MTTPVHNAFHKLCVQFGLFKGKNIVEELAFVRYFHNQPVNVHLHIVGFHFLAFMVLLVCLLLCPGSDLVVVGIYGTGMTLIDYPNGLVGLFVFVVFSVLDYCARYVALSYSFYNALGIAASSGAAGGVLQLFGHIYIDHSQPAFRAFEAFFSTPYYLYLFIFFKFGYKTSIRKQVIKATPMWTGSERVVYGVRNFSAS